MATRVAIVTGANKGIGYAIVKDLCSKFQGDVVLTARDEKRGKDAVASLEKLNLHLKFLQLDVDNAESIARFRDTIKELYGGIDVLVNNVGIVYQSDAKESIGEQAENTIRVNYTAMVNVCDVLFPLLRPHARVVNLTSSVGHLSRIVGKEPAASQLRQKLSSPSLTIEELNKLLADYVRAAKEGTHRDLGWTDFAYQTSKIGVSALTRIQQRELDAAGKEDIVVNAVHPGYVDTDLTAHKGPLTIEEGAVAPVYCSLLPPNIKEPRGAFIWRDTKEVDWLSPSTPSLH